MGKQRESTPHGMTKEELRAMKEKTEAVVSDIFDALEAHEASHAVAMSSLTKALYHASKVIGLSTTGLVAGFATACSILDGESKDDAGSEGEEGRH